MKKLARIKPITTALLGFSTLVASMMAQSPLSLEERERETDRKQMKQIHRAIMAYREQHNKLPDWLSDLVPDFISNPKLLISPKELRTGESRLWGYPDPKLKTSYVYEFSANRAGPTVNRNRDTPLSMMEWKSLQMEEFGEAIPLLRCHLHDPVLNLSYSGDTYETTLFWENHPSTLALVEKLGPGKGSPDAKHLNLTLLTAEGTPVKNAMVRASERETEYFHLPPVTFKSDENGTCRVRLGRGLIKSVAISFEAPGYAAAPIRFEGGDGVSVPAAYTVQFSRAVKIGGFVFTESGHPIPNAAIGIHGTVQDAAGQFVEFDYETTTTNAEGQWESTRVAEDFESISFTLSHSDFRPKEYFQIDGDEAGEEEVTRTDLLQRQGKFVMDPGIEILGQVKSALGQPIVGAKITLRSTDEPPKNTTRSTGLDGRYRFVVMEETPVSLVVEAPDYAPIYKSLSVEPKLEAQDFELDKGSPLTGHVTDKNGNPVEDAYASVASWHGQAILQWASATDSEGKFTWPNAPNDGLTLQITKAGYNSSNITIRENRELEVKLTKTFLLTGTVSDAETGAPIPQFNAIQGRVYDFTNEDRVNWDFRNVANGFDGILSVEGGPRFRLPPGMNVKYMVTAEGYLPEVSPLIQTSGWHEHHFRLRKGRGPHGYLLKPDGTPAEGSEVFLLGTGYTSLGKRKLERPSMLGSNVTHADASGYFALPAVTKKQHIAAVHESGYVEIEDFDPNNELRLQLEPWGAIEGTLYAGTRPWANQEITVSSGRPGETKIQYDFSNFRATTDQDGKFSIQSVPPGKRKLIVLIPSGNGERRSWSHSHMEDITVLAGKTTTVIHGKQGRPVIGKFELDAPDVDVSWNNGNRTLGKSQPRPPRGLSREAFREWSQSPEVVEARKNYRYYSFRIAEDGSFRIEGIPAGSYTLRIHLNEPGADRFTGRPFVMHTQEVDVPTFDGKVTDEPHDLGTINVKPLPNRP